MSRNIQIAIVEVAHRLSKYAFLKKVLSPFYSIYKQREYQKKKRVFMQYGLEALSLFDECLCKNGIAYTLAFGTLLGAIRERGFIKHDIDIDVSMFIDDYTDIMQSRLKEYGFKLIHDFLVEDGRLGREQTFIYKEVTIDVFYFYPPYDKYPYCCDFLEYGDTASFRESMARYGRVKARRLEIPISRERKLVSFESKQFYVPTNADQILEFRYGKDYMIPNPRWSIHSCDSHIVEWENVNAVCIEY